MRCFGTGKGIEYGRGGRGGYIRSSGVELEVLTVWRDERGCRWSRGIEIHARAESRSTAQVSTPPHRIRFEPCHTALSSQARIALFTGDPLLKAVHLAPLSNHWCAPPLVCGGEKRNVANPHTESSPTSLATPFHKGVARYRIHTHIHTHCIHLAEHTPPPPHTFTPTDPPPPAQSTQKEWTFKVTSQAESVKVGRIAADAVLAGAGWAPTVEYSTREADGAELRKGAHVKARASVSPAFS